jgi:hypothetical protein
VAVVAAAEHGAGSLNIAWRPGSGRFAFPAAFHGNF